MPDPIVTLENLTYTYPQRETAALAGVSLRVPAGELVVVAGPSGSGKSTLLRCLNGLVPHFTGGRIQGTVIVAGHDAIAAGPATMSSLVGFVTQNPEAQAVLERVEPEVAFALENAAVPPAVMRRQVPAILEHLDLLPLRDRRLDELSGGERQRVALATALVRKPAVLVLDEPTSQLDPLAAETLMAWLASLRRDWELTVIVAEHRLDRVLPYADRLILLAGGRVIASGPAATVAARLEPAPPLVAVGRALGWSPLPLSLAAAEPFARAIDGAVALGAKAQPDDVRAEARPGVLDIRGLRVRRGRQPVLDGVDLSVEPGEVLALLGRNGSGKTTLLQAVVGLLPAEAGDCRLDGASLAGQSVAARCRQIAYLPQNPDDLLFASSVREELDITLNNHGLTPADVAPGPDELLAWLGLAETAGDYPRDLSVGQRQRVAFAAVAVTGPRLLLLDEPTRGLDGPAKSALLAGCRRWLAEGAGLLLATHDVELVAALADRVAILEHGRISRCGHPGAVLPDHPHFAPQIARLFPRAGWLIAADVTAALGPDGRAGNRLTTAMEGERCPN